MRGQAALNVKQL